MGTSIRTMALVLACAAIATACTRSQAETVPASGAPASATPSPAIDWPLEDPLALEGAWTTGALTPDQMKERALLYAKERCVDAFIGEAGTITWDLYVRGGSWVLFRTEDDGEAMDVDAGSVTRYTDGYAVFHEVGAGEPMADFTTFVRMHDEGFTANYLDLDLVAPAEGDTPCFVRAASVVELTNTFMPMG
jgi:hypothetical protein